MAILPHTIIAASEQRGRMLGQMNGADGMVDVSAVTSPSLDPIWDQMRRDAERWAGEETALASWLHSAVLDQRAFEDSLAFLLSEKLCGAAVEFHRPPDPCPHR